MHHRSFNNQTNYQSNPYMPSQMNNAPCASYGPGTLNLASSHPVINIQSNPQPTYMYPPPVYNNPIYPPLVYVSGNSAPVCNLCHKSASSINRKRCGCAVITWSVCLLLFTGCLCWIPFVMDECYDH